MPQEPRQATAATQPYPRGDAFVPQSIAVAPEGFTLVNGGKIFTPFWTDAEVPIKPVVRRRRELAAELVRSGERLSLRLRAGSRRRLPSRRALRATPAGRRTLRRRHFRRVGPAELRRVRGARHAHEHARLAAAVGRRLLQRLDDDGGRAHVRRPQRRPADGARFAHRRAALGIPNGRRHERARQRVRALRQAVRRRLLGRQFVRRLAEGRQRLVVRLGRHAAARAAARRRDAVHARSRRHGRSRRRQSRLRHGVRVLPRRARRRRPRRRQGARGRASTPTSSCKPSAKAARTCRRSARR